MLFFTSPVQSQQWTCIIYGDTRTNDAAHRSVLAAMAANTPDYAFIVNVGDVVEDGNSLMDWNTWQQACDDMLGGTGQESVPPKYMACAGNHDNVDNPTGLINWKNYLLGQAAQFGNDGVYFYFDYENARFVVLEADGELDGAQLDLLQEAIDTNPHPWLFAIWHNPIFDFGSKQYEDELHDTWGIPLYENGCDIIFTGHAHHYVRTKKLVLNGEKNPPVDTFMGTTQIISGNGGAPLYPVDENNDNNAYMVDYSFDENTEGYYGYTQLDFDGNVLTLKEIRTDGTVMDSTVYFSNPKPNLNPRYVLDISIVGEGDVLRIPEYNQYYEGMSVKLIAQPDLGWVFDGWTGDLTGLELTDSLVMDTNKQVIAVFSKLPENKKELRIAIEGSGTVDLNPPGFYYEQGTQVHVTAQPDTMWIFDFWTGDVQSEEKSFDVFMDTHKSITAHFKALETFQLNTWWLGQGMIQLDPAGSIYIEDTRVTVSAVPEASWHFLEWTGDIMASSQADTLLMNSNKEIGALFYSNQSTVNVLYPTHDSYTRGGFFYATRNFNNMPYLLVQEGSSNIDCFRSYIQFDLSSLDGSVEAAWIKLTVTSDGLTGDTSVPVAMYQLEEDSWDESSLNWKLTPEEGRRLDRRDAVQTLEAVYAWDITSFIKEEIKSDMIASLLVKTTNSGHMVKFGNREGSNPPVLTVITGMGTKVENPRVTMPKTTQLYQNYPNPFNPITTISYFIEKDGFVTLKIYDILGREIKTLVDDFQYSGKYKYNFEADNMASGLFFYKLHVRNEYIKIRKMLLVR